MARITKTILVNLLVFTLLLIALEIFLRIKGDTYTWTENATGKYHSAWDQPVNQGLHIRTQGNYVEEYPEFSYKLSINSEGIRDINREIENRHHKVRIVGLGDSFMEGVGTPYDSTIMRLIETKDTIFEGICGGVAGSDVFRSYVLYDSLLDKYKPDYLLILFNNTDISDWVLNGNEIGILPSVKIPSKFRRNLFEYSHLYRSISINLFGYNWIQQSPEEQKETWDLFKIDFSLVLQKYIATLGKGQKLVFVFQPLYHEFVEGEYVYPFEELKQILSSSSIAYIDLQECLHDGSIDPKSLYWQTDMHFTPYGYSVVADCILNSNLVY